VNMGFLSGKVVIVIIACVSVIIISSIVIPIAVIFSGGESKTTASIEVISTTGPISTTATTSTNGGGKLILKFVIFISPKKHDGTAGDQISSIYSPTLWQCELWSFQAGGTKLERFLHQNQYTQRKLLNFEF
jgi:hypothetical protein